MSLIDIHCKGCDTHSEVYRSAADWPNVPACPRCDSSETEQVHLPTGMRSLPPAVVLYKAPDGTFRFPGSDDPHGRTATKYKDLGYERIEARGWAEVRRVEAMVNDRQRHEIRQRVERQCEMREAAIKARRSDVYNGMANSFRMPIVGKNGRIIGYRSVKLSERGKAIMRAAIEHNNNKPGPRSYDPGFHVSVFHHRQSEA